MTRRLKPTERSAVLGGVLFLGLLGSCAPPVTRSTVHATTVGNVRLQERWAPDRGVQSVTLQRDASGYALHIQAIRVCRVWEAEQRFHRRRWETNPHSGMIAGEVIMIGVGLGSTTAAWASTKDRCGSGDLLSSCDSFAHGVALLGTGLAAAGATALVVDLLSADSGEETSSHLGRAIPPHYAPCNNASLGGSVVRLVGPNISLSGVLNDKGVARLNVPIQVWVGTDGTLDLDVVVDGHVLGRVVMHREAVCDGC